VTRTHNFKKKLTGASQSLTITTAQREASVAWIIDDVVFNQNVAGPVQGRGVRARIADQAAAQRELRI
jgi:hypothetical protein